MKTGDNREFNLFVNPQNQSNGDVDNATVAAVLAEFPAFEFIFGGVEWTGKCIQDETKACFHYLAPPPETVTLSGSYSGRTSSPRETVADTLQAIPSERFFIQWSSGPVRKATLIVDDHTPTHVPVRCRVRLESQIAAESADILALLRNAEEFERAVGTVPSGVPLPSRRVRSVVDQYRAAAADFRISKGMHLPVNFRTGNAFVFGMLLLETQLDQNVFDATFFDAKGCPLEGGMVLERSVKRQGQSNGEVERISSTIGKVMELIP